MAKLIAILDHPLPQSMGIHPFVIEGGKAGIVLGWGEPRHLWEGDLREGVSIGSVMEIHNGPDIPGWEGKNLTVGWCGRRFVEKLIELSEQLGVLYPRPLTSFSPCYVERAGTYWIADRDQVIEEFQQWLRWAAPIAIRKNSAPLAELMEQCSPSSLDTRAALLATRKTPEEYAKELEWFARLNRDNGNEPRTPEEVEKQLLLRIDEIRGE